MPAVLWAFERASPVAGETLSRSATSFRGGGGSTDLRRDRHSSRRNSGAEIPSEFGNVLAAHGGDPGASPKNLSEHIADQAAFREQKLQPALDAAAAGEGPVFFVDATHLVFGTFLTCLWCFTRLFVRAASGRQRFHVLGAWKAITRELVSVTNTTMVNAETMCELLRKIAALRLTGPSH